MVQRDEPLQTRLARAVRAHLAETQTQVVTMPRAGPGIGAEDARQLTHALYAALLEDLEATGRANRDAFVEDVLGACKASGISVETMIKGIVRAYVVLVAKIGHELAPDERDEAGRKVGEFVGPLVCDVVRTFGADHG